LEDQEGDEKRKLK